MSMTTEVYICTTENIEVVENVTIPLFHPMYVDGKIDEYKRDD